MLLIYRHGPLVCHWTMRFEAKHCYFKRIANRLGNFKNISYTLAARHQQLQCYLSIDKSTIDGPALEVGPGYITCSTDIHGFNSNHLPHGNFMLTRYILNYQLVKTVLYSLCFFDQMGKG